MLMSTASASVLLFAVLWYMKAYKSIMKIGLRLCCYKSLGKKKTGTNQSGATLWEQLPVKLSVGIDHAIFIRQRSITTSIIEVRCVMRIKTKSSLITLVR